MEFTVENMCGFLIRSKLMTADEMQAMRQRWLTESRDAASQLPLFLKWLVGRRYVTEYQAGLLARGHTDDFFLGPYKILERIGRGRMAGVYRAMHPSGQVVAIKVLPPSRAKNGQLLARFQREARLAVKLKHPHVVRSFQLGESKGVHYLVMELLEGEPLDEVLARRKRLPPGEAVRLVFQALLGLQHIHEQGMVHRDLKPANMMVLPAPVRGANETTLKSNVKILDIGLARELFDESNINAQQDELTGEGVLLGTPDYLAPEQARDPRTIDIRADIYSLGCVLYQFLTGQTPFPDKNILNQMIRHASETPRPIADLVPNLPEGLQQIVNWMMAKDADKRYPTPGRASQALQAFMMVASESTKASEETPQLRRYLTWLDTGDVGEPDKASATLKPASHSDVPTAKPSSHPAVPAAKPASHPAVPVAKPASHSSVPAAKPAANPGVPMAAKSKPPQAEANPKKRTGVQLPTAAPAAATAAHVPLATPLPAAPAPAAAAGMPIEEQVDVELVPLPELTATPAKRLGKREIVMLTVGAGVMMFLLGCGWTASIVMRWFGG